MTPEQAVVPGSVSEPKPEPGADAAAETSAPLAAYFSSNSTPAAPAPAAPAPVVEAPVAETPVAETSAPAPAESAAPVAEAAPAETPAPAVPTAAPAPDEFSARSPAPLDAELESEINAALDGVSGLSAATGTEAVPVGTSADATGKNKDKEGLHPGRRLKGKVLSIHADNIIVDIGTRESGLLQVKQFEEGKLPAIGDTVDVVVSKIDTAEGLVQLNPAKTGVSKPSGNWEEVVEGQIVDCMVTKSNKGGLEVSLANIRGFLPASQVELGFVSNLEQFVGQKLRVKVIEVNPKKKNLVVSRRAYMEIMAAEVREEAWKKLSVGQRLTGKVKTLKDYGAFVDIGGVDGLLHVGEMSWKRINHPKDILAEGQEVEVEIVGLDRDKGKISLSMKRLATSPWDGIESRYPAQTTVHGKVTRTTEFGAFVELEPGIEGMVHISELDHRRVPRVTDIMQVGKEYDLQVLQVDRDKKRIALSLKALVARPEGMKKSKVSDEDLAPGGGKAYERKNKGPLKGGGTSTGGLLFGSPGKE